MNHMEGKPSRREEKQLDLSLQLPEGEAVPSKSSGARSPFDIFHAPRDPNAEDDSDAENSD